MNAVLQIQKPNVTDDITMDNVLTVSSLRLRLIRYIEHRPIRHLPASIFLGDETRIAFLAHLSRLESLRVL